MLLWRRTLILITLGALVGCAGGTESEVEGPVPGERRAEIEPLVRVEEISEYQGQPSFRVETESATWVFQRAGAAFASLIDRDGADWISYRPTGGADGKYRGIPNLIHPEGDFHPGGEGSTTELLEDGPLRVRLTSRTRDGRWEGSWEIYPTHARFMLTKAARPYWFLYEGTPGGALDPEHDFYLLSDGTREAVGVDFARDLPDPEWIAFGDDRTERVLVIAHHADDDKLDQFYQMEGQMTVFGFGREYRCCAKYLEEVPATYTVALVESWDPAVIGAAVEGMSR